MLKIGSGNENIALAYFYKILPIKPPHFRYSVSLSEVKKFRDGWYILQDVKVPSQWEFKGKNRDAMNPEKNMNKILKFAERRFGHNQYEAELKNLIHKSKSAEYREFDFVIVYVENHELKRWVSIEVASDDHYIGKYFLQKTISDCLKLNCDYANPVLLDARQKSLPTLPQQVQDCLADVM